MATGWRRRDIRDLQQPALEVLEGRILQSFNLPPTYPTGAGPQSVAVLERTGAVAFASWPTAEQPPWPLPTDVPPQAVAAPALAAAVPPPEVESGNLLTVAHPGPGRRTVYRLLHLPGEEAGGSLRGRPEGDTPLVETIDP